MDDITYKDALIIGSFQGCCYFSSHFSFWNDNCRALWRKLDRETVLTFLFTIDTSHRWSYRFAICRRFSRKAESISSTSLIVGTLSAAFLDT